MPGQRVPVGLEKMRQGFRCLFLWFPDAVLVPDPGGAAGQRQDACQNQQPKDSERRWFITILSPSGKITRYLYGLHFLPFDFKMALIEAQKGIARPTINRVLEYCFNYDPEGRKYALDITKISATLIIFFALVFLAILILMTRKKRKKDQQEKKLQETQNKNPV